MKPVVHTNIEKRRGTDATTKSDIKELLLAPEPRSDALMPPRRNFRRRPVAELE